MTLEAMPQERGKKIMISPHLLVLLHRAYSTPFSTVHPFEHGPVIRKQEMSSRLCFQKEPSIEQEVEKVKGECLV
jgi:hypothetical protein